MKFAVIHRHRNEYPVSVMCKFFGVSRSGYYVFVSRLGRPEKDAALAVEIRIQQDKSFKTYGYRRMWLALKKNGIHHNPKTILRVMKKYAVAGNGSTLDNRYTNMRIFLTGSLKQTSPTENGLQIFRT